MIDGAPIAAEFGISRTPVREALLQLKAMGLIRRLPRKGAVVFRPSLEEFLAILEVHAKPEGQAAGLTARAACAAHAAAHADAYYQLNLRFRESVAVAGGNPFLTEMIKTNARKLLAYYYVRYRTTGAIAASARDHRSIASLIASRDATGAVSQMQRRVHFVQISAMDLIAALP